MQRGATRLFLNKDLHIFFLLPRVDSPAFLKHFLCIRLYVSLDFKLFNNAKGCDPAFLNE